MPVRKHRFRTAAVDQSHAFNAVCINFKRVQYRRTSRGVSKRALIASPAPWLRKQLQSAKPALSEHKRTVALINAEGESILILTGRAGGVLAKAAKQKAIPHGTAFSFNSEKITQQSQHWQPSVCHCERQFPLQK